MRSCSQTDMRGASTWRAARATCSMAACGPSSTHRCTAPLLGRAAARASRVVGGRRGEVARASAGSRRVHAAAADVDDDATTVGVGSIAPFKLEVRAPHSPSNRICETLRVRASSAWAAGCQSHMCDGVSTRMRLVAASTPNLTRRLCTLKPQPRRWLRSMHPSHPHTPTHTHPYPSRSPSLPVLSLTLTHGCLSLPASLHTAVVRAVRVHGAVPAVLLGLYGAEHASVIGHGG